MKSSSVRFLVALSAVLTLSSGCRAQEPAPDLAETALPEAEEFQEVPPNPLHDLYIAVDQKLELEDKPGATAIILAALDEEKYAPHKAELFTTVIRFLLFTEQIDEAKTRFLNIIRTEPELALPGFDLIYGHYVRAGDAAATLDWVRQLHLQPLTPEMKRPASEWLFAALLEAGETAEIAEKLPAFLEEFSAEDAMPVVQRLCSTAQQTQQYEFLDTLLAQVEASGKKDDAGLKNVVLSNRLLGLAGRDRWEAVAEAFPAAVEALPDGSLQSLFSNLAGTARRTKKPEQAEALAWTLLQQESGKDKTGSRNAAAREWIAAAVAREEYAAVPERIAVLFDLKIPPRQIYSNISRHFYAMMDHPAAVRDILVQADKLSPLLEEDSSRNALKALMLDGAFIVEDYDRAMALLEQGIADRDEAWHAMATTKVKAHKALQDKDVDEAVKQFRAFMAIIAETEEPSPDPVSNVLHTREMILGRNTKRIGDIYREAGRADEAAKAYAEARVLYDKALAENESGEETEKLIRQEMAEIPAQ